MRVVKKLFRFLQRRLMAHRCHGSLAPGKPRVGPYPNTYPKGAGGDTPLMQRAGEEPV